MNPTFDKEWIDLNLRNGYVRECVCGLWRAGECRACPHRPSLEDFKGRTFEKHGSELVRRGIVQW